MGFQIVLNKIMHFTYKTLTIKKWSIRICLIGQEFYNKLLFKRRISISKETKNREIDKMF